MTTLTKPGPTRAQTKSARLERLTQTVDRWLERRLPPATREPRVVHEGMRYAVCSGGKRFRPLLVLGACEAVGRAASAALPVAGAIELLHTYSLVHDDLPAMDNAELRRGQPSCHRRFGEGNAILIGDALLTLAFEWLGGSGFPNALAIIQTIGRACGTEGLIGGQVMDLEQHEQQPQSIVHSPQSIVERYTAIAKRKTGALITASVVAGGLAGGAGPQPLARLRRYGQGIGLAFQLIDDLHDDEALARAMGREAAAAEARRLIAKALTTLAPFGNRARTLQELAAWLDATM